MAKTVFSYDPYSGEYLGETLAHRSPRGEGYLMPAFSAAEAPPATGEREVAVYRDGAWSVVPDWRGHIYWLADGSEHEIKELGEEPPVDALAEPPPPPPPEPEYKTRFSVLEFRDRFTHEEAIAIRQAQFTDMEVGLVYDAFHAAQFIDLGDPRVEQGLALYVARGLLTAERKAQLMAPELISDPS